MFALSRRSKSPNISINKPRKIKKQGSNEEMSVKTRHFIKKICFQQATSVDMTKYGFVVDSKLQPINLMLKPLKDQLDKIIGGNTNNRPTTPQSIIKQPSKKRDENRSVIFKDEKEKINRPRKIKKTNTKTHKHNSKTSLLIKSKIKRTKANKNSIKITCV